MKSISQPAPLRIVQTNRPRISDVTVLLILLSILFFSLLGSHALLIPDEGRYGEIAREMFVTRDYITPHFNGIVFLDKPILFYWLEVFSIKLLGLHEWSLRLWPALFGILGCLMMYVSGCLLFNRRTGILATFILSTTLLYFFAAHYVNMDLEVAVLITGALLSFIVASRYTVNYKESYYKNGLMLAYLFSGLAVLTKGLIGFVIPVLVIGLWALCLKRWRLLIQIYLPRGVLLIFLVVAPWFIMEQRAIPGFFHYFFVTQHFSRFLSENFNGRQPFWFYLPVVLIGLLPWTVFLLQMLIKEITCVCKNAKLQASELFLLIWVFVVLAFFSLPSSKIIGYMLPIFPPIALLIARYFDSVWNTLADHSKDSNRLRGGIYFFIALILGIAVGICASIYYASHAGLVNSHFMQINLPRLHSAGAYFYLIAVLLVVMSFIAAWQLTRKTLLGSLVNIIVGMSVFFFIIMAAVPSAHLSSSKPLSLKLAHFLKPTDEIVVYHQCYQDLPFYLQRRITVIEDWHAPNIAQVDNWRRELWEGSHYQKASDYLVDDKEFKKYFFLGHPRFFIFTDPLSFEALKKQGYKLYELNRYNNILLLSNKKAVTP